MEQAHDIVVALANAVEAKDLGLKDHCRYLAYRSARLAAYVGLRDGELEGVAYGALLHDIGKIGIAEHVLHKPGPLTRGRVPASCASTPRSASASATRCACRATSRPSSATTTSAGTAPAIPTACEGEAIPLGARIVALADAFDAIVRGRPYRARTIRG